MWNYSINAISILTFTLNLPYTMVTVVISLGSDCCGTMVLKVSDSDPTQGIQVLSQDWVIL